jgi:competence protein ComEC
MHRPLQDAADRALPRQAMPSARYQPLVMVLVFVAIGIVLDRTLPIRAEAWWLLALAAWLGWFIFRRYGYVRAGCVTLLSCGLALGGAWQHAHWNWFAADDLGLYATFDPQPICLRAVALSSPRRVAAKPFDPLSAMPSAQRSRLELRAEAVRAGRDWLPATGLATLEIDGELVGIEAGDQLQLYTQISAPSPALNAGEFDFAEHLRGNRQLCRLWCDSPAQISVIKQARGISLARLLDRVRGIGNRLLWQDLDRRRSGVAAALLLGSREQLDDAHNNAYFLTGMIHVLSISGMHIAILAGGLFWFLRLGLVTRNMALAGVALLTILYALLIDAEPPAVRATIIVLVACASAWSGRQALAFNSLAAAALVVLAMNPTDLFRVGPQLSFLAAAVLGYCGVMRSRRAPIDPLDRLIAQSRPWPLRWGRTLAGRLGAALLLTTAVWLVTLPLIATRFHVASPAALVLTPLLAIPFSVGLLTGFGVLVFGWLMPPLGTLTGLICDRALDWSDRCVDLGAKLPASHFWIVGPPSWWVAMFYLLLALVVAIPRSTLSTKARLATIGVWSLLGCVLPYTVGASHDRLVCNILSVGHGCCVVLELPDGRTIMYDAGRLGGPQTAARSISGHLWSRGITHLDAVIVSHADVDHYNALPDLFERFRVDRLLVSLTMRYDSSVAVQTLFDAAGQAGVSIDLLSIGQTLPWGGECQLKVLHPPAEGLGASDNADSIVLLVEYRGRKILLPGDLETPGLEMLESMPPIDTDVLLAPHHGSLRSDPPGFVAWSTPEWVVLSGSHQALDRQAVEVYRREGARVLHTATSGAVTVTIDERGLQVTARHEPPLDAETGKIQK